MRQTTKKSAGVISGIMLPMGLICMFAFCSLALSLMGGRAYKSVQAGVDESFGSSVAASYLRTKIAQNNTEGSIFIHDFDGVEALVITSEQNDREYETRIYVQDGMLMESFVAADQAFGTTGSIEIAEVTSCTFAISDDGLFTADIVSVSGAYSRIAFALAGGGV